MQLTRLVIEGSLAAIAAPNVVVRSLLAGVTITMKAHTSSIVHEDARIAGRDLAHELIDEMDCTPDLVLMFVSAKYDVGAVLDGFYGVCGENVHVAGCTSYAEIDQEGGKTESVTAMGMKFGAGVSATTISATVQNGDSRELGQRLGSEAKSKDASLVLVFPDGMAVNGTQFLLGLQDELGSSFPIIGGVAADLGEFKQTFEIHDRQVLTGGATVVVFTGSLKVTTAAKSGWIPVGATRRANKVENGNLCLEIDGRPALDLYEEYLGARASEMPGVSVEFPVGMVGGVPSTQRMADDSILLLRAIKGVDRERRAIMFGGDLPEGAEIRMTTATKADVITGADEAGARVSDNMPKATIALVFDCMARKVVLGPRYRDELKNTFAKLGNIPRIGFYTYGELSPVQGVTMHHDETFTIALIEG
jgi:hypothetical protein